MALGVVTAMLRDHSTLLDQLRWAAENGYEGVEVSCTPGPPGFDGVWQHRERDWSSYRQQLRAAVAPFRSVALHASFSHFYDPTYVTYHDLLRDIRIDEAAWAQDLADDLDARAITVHSGWLVHGADDASRLNSFIDSLERLDRLSEGRRAKIGVETTEMLLPLEHCEVLRRLALKNVGLTIDIGHVHIHHPVGIPVHDFKGPAYAAYGTSRAFLGEFAPLAVDVHLHDSTGEENHLAIGLGHVDFAEQLATLARGGYAGPVNLEARGDGSVQLAMRDTIMAAMPAGLAAA